MSMSASGYLVTENQYHLYYIESQACLDVWSVLRAHPLEQ